MKNLFLLLITCLLLACKKDREAKPKPICLITRIDKTGGSFSIYEYDESKRLKSFYVYKAPEVGATESKINYTIERDNHHRIYKIVANYGIGYSLITKTFEYDNQGRWIRAKLGPTFDANILPNIYTTTDVDYNSEGLIAKTTDTHGPLFFYSNTYEYQNKNLIRSIFEANSTSTCQYEYYLNKETKPGEIDLLKIYLANFSSPVAASPAKNILKKFTKDDVALEEYTYEFNEYGYPNRIITQPNAINATKSVTSITYMCN
jgi:hypothetical protein